MSRAPSVAETMIMSPAVSMSSAPAKKTRIAEDCPVFCSGLVVPEREAIRVGKDGKISSGKGHGAFQSQKKAAPFGAALDFRRSPPRDASDMEPIVKQSRNNSYNPGLLTMPFSLSATFNTDMASNQDFWS